MDNLACTHKVICLQGIQVGNIKYSLLINILLKHTLVLETYLGRHVAYTWYTTTLIGT